MSAPADRIRPVLQAISTAFPHKDTHDALAALAELERERENQVQVCARLASERACEMVRADVAERERDELRAGLERLTRLYEDEHDLCERPMWLQELIARPRKDGE